MDSKFLPKDAEIIDLTNTPDNYDDGKYLTSTTSGTKWMAHPGGVFGALADYVYDETTNSTTSTNFVNKLTLTTSGISTGTYRIGWSYERSAASASDDFLCRVQLNDTTELNNTRTRIAPSNIAYFFDAGGFVYIDLTAGDYHVDLDFCSSKNGKAVAIRRVSIEIWRVE